MDEPEWGAATIASKIRETVEKSGKDAPIYLRYGPANLRKSISPDALLVSPASI